jgi:hypothetical protein
MIRCYHCGTDNLDGSEYCDECGTRLSSAEVSPRQTSAPPPAAQFITQVAPPPPPSFTKDTITPKPATPYTPPPPPVSPPVNQAASQSAGQSAAGQATNRAAGQAANFPPPPNVSDASANNPQSGVQSPNQTTTINHQTDALRGGAAGAGSGRQQAMNNEDKSGASPARAKLIIQRGGKVGKEFPITNAESMIGRWDADGGIFPDIDLDQDDPEAKVSRRHARIQFSNNQYLIEDLGSTNGTFINRGPRLLPGTKQPLNNGDEIIVGKTFLKFVLS